MSILDAIGKARAILCEACSDIDEKTHGPESSAIRRAMQDAINKLSALCYEVEEYMIYEDDSSDNEESSENDDNNDGMNTNIDEKIGEN